MNKKTISVTKLLLALLAGCTLAASTSCVDEGGASKVGEVAKSEKSEAGEEPSAQEKYSVGDIVETKNLRISYLSCGEYTGYDEFSKPKDGNKVIFCEFEFENISDSDKLASALDFNCFADDNSCSEYMWSNDDYLSATISSGRKAKGKVYYEVPKDAKDIELEYESSWLSSSKIVFLYK